MQTIWGFDLGVTSVGFAVIRWDEGAERGEIQHLGVRVFTESRENAQKGKVGDPLNATRRQKRLARRTLRRKRWRRVHLRRALVEAGLLPPEAEPGPGRVPAAPPPGFDPYETRRRGLTEALAAHDLGWALFHLLKRRGYQGSRKYGSADDEGSKTAAPAPAKGRRSRKSDAPAPEERDDEARKQQQARAKREQLRREIAAIAERDGEDRATVAAALMERRDKRLREEQNQPAAFPDPVALRDVQQARDMISGEFDRLWRLQAEHHPTVLTEALRCRITHIGFSQRPTFFRTRTIGRCIHAPEENRALKGDWLTQHFETLVFVNNLRLARGNNPPLSPEQRAAAIAYLEGGFLDDRAPEPKGEAKPSWTGLRAALGDERLRFTHERGEKETIRGNATEAALRRALGPTWQALDPAARDAIRAAIGAAIRHAEYRPAQDGAILEIRDRKEWAEERCRLAKRAQRDWGLTKEAAEALAGISLPDGYGRHARSTMERLLPHLERGLTYPEAVKIEFPTAAGAPVTALPAPNPSRLLRIEDEWLRREMAALLAGIRNPTVLRTLGELRKVVNTLLRAYGRPDLIRLELFRGLKQSREERERTDKAQVERETKRRQAATHIAELGKPVTGEAVLRWLLWEEQGRRSPYSGKPISCAQALDPAATEIDHIFPISRSFDNGFANKVLCLADENRDKRDRLPREWLATAKPDTWAVLETTIWPAMQKCGWPGWDGKHGRPVGKWARCLKEQIEEAGSEAFLNRHATDSAFIATAARDYLGLLFGGGQKGVNAVQTVPGRATALLRDAWSIGLSRLLHGVVEADGAPKARDDLRHHAVDALVVAVCAPSKVQALSRWWQVRETRHEKPEFRTPWPDFHAQVRRKLETLLVSHRVQAKLSGPLHAETYLGLRQDPYQKGERILVTRKSLDKLGPNEVERIVDKRVRETVQEAVKQHGSIKAAAAAGVRLRRADGSPGPFVLKVRLKNRIQNEEGSLAIAPERKTYTTGVALHHIALYGPEAKPRAYARKLVDVVRWCRNGEPTVRQSESGQPLLCALFVSDALRRKTATGDDFIRVVRFESDGRIVHKPIHIAGSDLSGGGKTSLAVLWRDGWRKITVDPIGRWRPAR